MDWFERLTGFCETDYADTRGKLRVEGRKLQSLINGKSCGIGDLELVSHSERILCKLQQSQAGPGSEE